MKVIRKILRKKKLKKSKTKNLIISYEFCLNILVEKKWIINQILLSIHAFSYWNFFGIITVMLEITSSGKMKLRPFFVLSIQDLVEIFVWKDGTIICLIFIFFKTKWRNRLNFLYGIRCVSEKCFEKSKNK